MMIMRMMLVITICHDYDSNDVTLMVTDDDDDDDDNNGGGGGGNSGSRVWQG